MFKENRVFQITLLVSLIVHGTILFQNPNFNLFSNLRKTDEKLEVSYVKEQQVNKEEQLKLLPRKELLPSVAVSKLTSRKINPPPFVDREGIFNKSPATSSRQPEFTKPTFIKSDVISVKKIITMPAIDLDKIDNPSYINYYQVVREKIRRSAYQHYAKAEVGEIYLSFLVTKEGFLRDVRLIEAKSSPNPYLKEIALKSIRNSSPFPTFPKELDYPQLSFNVVISFEVE
ncbi:MAG: energy transducer TonB [Candidatus Omnitrophica bacterium]|nr:energy transducer TonB [Candidatus Omnitrophota bacterium]